MKKFAFFLAPLMAISFLTNCGGQSGPKQYTVTFDSNEGTPVASQKVIENECAVEPKDPSRAEDEQGAYAFKEWQLDGNKFDFSTPINKNLTLKANWDITHKYSVTVGTCTHLSFTTTDGKGLDAVKVIEGQDFTFKMKAINEEGSTDYLVPSFINITVNGMMLEPTSCPITRISDFEANVTIKGSKITGNIVISGSAAIKDRYTYQFFAHDGLKDIPSGSQTTDKDITLTLEPLDGCKKPKAENILILFDNVPGENPRQWVSPAEKLDEYCTYEESESTGTLTIKHKYIKNNVYIVTRAHNFKLLESLSWDKINQYSLAGWAPYIFYLGEEKTIQLKDQNIKHKIRIIDFNHDELSTSTEEKKQFAGITFEFANLLSDSSGYSLATLWNTKDGSNSTNHDYLNSDLRKALDGQGTGTLRWYQMGSERKSTDYTMPVIDMLPEELRNNIKTIKKYVAKGTSYEVKDYDTRVFALTHNEMTQSPSPYAKVEGTTYQYYKDHDDNSSRIKHQIKWHDGAVTGYKEITDLIWHPYNYAGYNNSTYSNGGNYWLDSPRANGSGDAWRVRDDGRLLSRHIVYIYAFAVAPAFCI